METRRFPARLMRHDLQALFALDRLQDRVEHRWLRLPCGAVTSAAFKHRWLCSLFSFASYRFSLSGVSVASW